MLKKTTSKTGSSCRVTLKVTAPDGARTVAVLGEFNDWDPTAHSLTQRKDGSFSTTISVAAGRRYRFRYLIDDQVWLNDDAPDSFVPNQFGGQDSVLET